MRRHIHKLAQWATWPSEKISEGIDKIIPHDRKKGKVAVGVCLMVGASQVATSYPVGCIIPHCLWDAGAYLLHAFGATPVIEAYIANKKQRKAEELKQRLCKQSDKS